MLPGFLSIVVVEVVLGDAGVNLLLHGFLYISKAVEVVFGQFFSPPFVT